MAILDFTDQLVKAEIMPDGQYELRVLKAEERTARTSGNQYLWICYAFTEHPQAQVIFEMLHYPANTDDQGQKVKRSGMLKKFGASFGLDIASQELDIDTLPGTILWANVKSRQDEGYDEANVVSSYIKAKVQQPSVDPNDDLPM